MERTSEFFELLPAFVKQHAAAVKACIGKSFKPVFGTSNNNVRQAGNVVNERIANVGDVVRVACHRPDLFSKLFFLQFVKFTRIIDA
ncbi:MAG: hypothetical protein ACI8Z1_000770, partial [Candidatus Azotimanducaceae bacterium]